MPWWDKYEAVDQQTQTATPAPATTQGRGVSADTSWLDKYQVVEPQQAQPPARDEKAIADTWQDAKYFERNYNAEPDPELKRQWFDKMVNSVEQHVKLGGSGDERPGQLEAGMTGQRVRDFARQKGVRFIDVPESELPGAADILRRQEEWFADPANRGQQPPESLMQVQRGDMNGRLWISPQLASALVENYRTRTDPNRAYQAPGFWNDFFTGNAAERDAAERAVAGERTRAMPGVSAEAIGGGPNMASVLLQPNDIAPEYNAAEEVGRRFVRGSNAFAGDVLGGGTSMVGSAIRAVTPESQGTARSAANDAGAWLQQAGQDIRRPFEDVANSIDVSASGQGFQPGNWKWWVGNVAEQTPAFTAMLVPGMALGRVAQIAGASERAATWLARGTAFSTSATIEGTSAYNNVFDRLRAAGASDDDAHRLALIEGASVGIINGSLEQVPFAEFVLKDKQAMNVILRATRGFLAEGVTEGYQEVAPIVVAQLIEKGELSPLDRQQAEQVLTSALIGGAMGAGAGSFEGGALRDQQTPEQIPFPGASDILSRAGSAAVQPGTETPATAIGVPDVPRGTQEIPSPAVETPPATPAATPEATPGTQAPENVEVAPGITGTVEDITPEQAVSAERELAKARQRAAETPEGARTGRQSSETPEIAPAGQSGAANGASKGFSGPVFPRREAAVAGATEIANAAIRPMYLVRTPDGWGYDQRAPAEGPYEIVHPGGRIEPGVRPENAAAFAGPERRKPQPGNKYAQSDPAYVEQKTRLRAYQFEPGTLIHGTTAQDIERIGLQGISPSRLSGRVDAEQIGEGRQSVGTAVAYAGKGGKGDPAVVVISPNVDRADSDGGAGAVDVSSRGRDRVLPKDIEAVIFGDGAEFSRKKDGAQFLAKAIDHARGLDAVGREGTNPASTERKPNGRRREEPVPAVPAPAATGETAAPASPAEVRSGLAPEGSRGTGEAPVASVPAREGQGIAAQAAEGGIAERVPSPAGGRVGEGSGEGREGNGVRADDGNGNGGRDAVQAGRPERPAAGTGEGEGAGGTARSVPERQPGTGERTAAGNLTEKEERMSRLADAIVELIRNGESIRNAIQLNALASTHMGGTAASGAFTATDAYEAQELALNRLAAADPIVRYAVSADAEPVAAIGTAIEKIDGWLSKTATQTVRTDQKQGMQQFSTPPTYGALVAWLARPRRGDIVLEPSAGTGSLVAPLASSVEAVQLNELDGERLRLAATLPNVQFGSAENAEQIANILPRDPKFRRPTLVVMNPPFSQTAGRMGTKKVLMVGANHIEQALKLLEPGGRLVAIVGRGMSMTAPTYATWWQKIRTQYDVRANVGIAGEVYSKYGTSFETRLLVIDKRPPSGQTVLDSVDAGKGIGTLVKAAELLQGVRDDRPAIQSTGRGGAEAAGEGGRAGSDPGTAGAGVAGPAPDRAGREGEGQRQRDVQPEREAGAAGGTAEGTGVRVPDEQPRGGDAGVRVGEQPDAGGVGNGAGVAATRTERGDEGVTGPAVEQPTAATVLEVVKRTKGKAGQLSDLPYESYEPAKVKIRGAQPHPTPLVESAAMATVEPPDPTYVPKLDQKVIADGVLSAAQLETIVYAGQATGTRLVDGRARGFFCGDGTGLGKGRTIAGIIADSFARGQKRALWVSMRDELRGDAERDLTDVRVGEGKVIAHSKFTLKDKIAGDGVLFTSYATLRSNFNREAPRWQQVADWLGKDFDGVIVFDEAHQMKNAIETEGLNAVEASATAQAALALQDALPNARVHYFSATGATEVHNLAYAERLGLWGEGTPFADKKAFIEQIEAGGVAAMELVARDMKQQGVYIARQIDYSGVTQDRLTHKLTASQRTTYSKVAQAWQLAQTNMMAALRLTASTGEGKIDGRAKGRMTNQFYAAQQRFFDQMMVAMQMPSVIADIERELAGGRSAVLQLTNTQAAVLERAMAGREKGQSLEEIDLSPKRALIEMVRSVFPVAQYEEYVDPLTGKTGMRLVKDSAGNPVENPQAVAMRERLIEDLASVEAPDGALDQLLRHFGPDAIAENTGRTRRLVYRTDPQTGERKLTEERRSSRAALGEVREFNEGKRRILVFSAAGGTGASYHASRTIKNQQQRVHYLVQAGWTADVAVQGFGRTHRSNQVQPPHYRLVTTDLRGQGRFISTIAKRLEQLGAITRGDRRSGGSLFTAADNLESTEARDALQAFFSDLRDGRVQSIDIDEFEKQTGLSLRDAEGRPRQSLPPVTQFLNRLLALEPDLQNTVFDEFAVRLERIVARKAAEGTLDTGVENIRADSAKVEVDKLAKKHESGAETRYVRLALKHKNKPMTFAALMSGKNALRRAPDFFVRNKRSGKVYAISELDRATTDTSTGVTGRKAIMFGPLRHEGVMLADVQDEERYEPIDKIEAEARWAEQVKESPEFRNETLHLITGVMLPVWDRVRGKPTVRRVQTDDGTRLLGRVVAEGDVPATLRALGLDVEKPNVTGDELVRHVIEDGRMGVFANGWRLIRSKVAGEDRLELIGPSLADHILLDRWGVTRQMMAFKMRYFVPTGDAGGVVLERVMKTHELQELVNASRPQSYSGVDADSGRVIDPDGVPADADLSAFGAGQQLPEHVAAWWGNTPLDDGDLAMSGGDNDHLADLVSADAKKPATPTAPRTPVSPLPGGTDKTLRQIVDDFADALGKRPRLGHIRKGGGKAVLGTYFWNSMRTNVRRHTDLQTVAHELAGHLIDDRYGILAPWVSSRQRSPYDAELIPAFSQHGSVTTSGPRSSLRYQRAEGLAEWVRAYVVNPDAAKAAAPTFWTFFQTKVPGQVIDALNAYSDDVRRFYGMPAEGRQAAAIDMKLTPATTTLVQKMQRVMSGDFWREVRDTARYELLDDLAPLADATAEARMIRTDLPALRARNDPILLARLFAGESKRVQAAIEYGVPKAFTTTDRADDVDGGIGWLIEPIASGLTDPTIEELNERMREALVYLVGDRVVYKAKQWIDDAKATIAALDPADPKYTQKSAKIMRDVYDRVENMSGAGAGAELDVKTASDAIQAIASDPVKLQRVQEFQRRYQAWGKGLLKYWYDMGRISGESYQRILDRNEIYADLHRVMDEAGGASRARLGKRLGAVKQVLYKFEGSTREINNPLVNLMQQTADMLYEADRNYVVNQFTELLRRDRGMHEGLPMDLDAIGSQAKRGDPNTVRVYNNGKEEFWQYRDDVLKAVKRMGESPDHGPIFRAVSMVIKTLPQIGITQNPAFVIRQLMRDPIYRAIVSRTGSTVQQAFDRYSPAERQELERMGGFQGGLYIYDEAWDSRMRREIGKLAGERTNLIMSPQRGWQLWTDLTAELGDTRTRLAEFRTAKAKFLKEGMSDFDAGLRAALEARSGGAIDYAMAGRAVRQAAPYVLFLNPAIQGLRRSMIAAKENPRRFIARWGAYVVLPRLAAMLIRALAGDEDEYAQMPAWRRDFFLSVKVDGFWLSIPQPYELGVLGGVLERGIYAARGYKRQFEGVPNSLVQALSPVGELPIFAGVYKGLIENAANHQFFFDRSIVPDYEKGLDVSLRKGTVRASRLGQALQAVTGTDARYVDNLIYNTFGGMGAVAMTLSNIGRADKPSMDLVNALGGITRPTVAGDSTDVQRLYEISERLGLSQSDEMQVLRGLVNRYNSAPSLTAKNEAAEKLRKYAARVRDTWERQYEQTLRAKQRQMGVK